MPPIERQCACDGEAAVRCVSLRENRSDVDDRFPGGVRKTSPRKTEQAKHNQDDPKRLLTAASLGGGS